MTDKPFSSPTEGELRDVMSAEQAAEYLQFNPYTVRRKAANGEIPGRKIGKGKGEWRFSRRALLAFIEGREVIQAPGQEWGGFGGSDPSDDERTKH